MKQPKNKRALKIHNKAKRALRQIEKQKTFNMLRLPNQICFFLTFFNRKHGFFLENVANLESLSLEQLIHIRDLIPSTHETCLAYGRTVPIIDNTQEQAILKGLTFSNAQELFKRFLVNPEPWNVFYSKHETLIDELTDDSQVGDLQLREIFYLNRNYQQQLLEVKKMKIMLKYLYRDVIRLIDVKGERK